MNKEDQEKLTMFLDEFYTVKRQADRARMVTQEIQTDERGSG